jgi:hypothetical protein
MVVWDIHNAVLQHFILQKLYNLKVKNPRFSVFIAVVFLNKNIGSKFYDFLSCERSFYIFYFKGKFTFRMF